MKKNAYFNQKKFLLAACGVLACSFSFFIYADIEQIQFEAIKATNKPWSILTYMQADNDLATFADYNIKNMQVGILDDSVLNKLVQWDQPDSNKTWRYRIVRGGRIEDESVSAEMGHNPSKELVDSMRWVVRKYPADRYGLILWNHGSGVQDYRKMQPKSPQTSKHIRSWIELPGLAHKNEGPESKEERGILYDDSQGTCLDNQGLYDAMRSIAITIGRRLDFLGMDACLMAMIEVCYQVRQFADVFIGSQQTEPGEGWNYKTFLASLTAKPSMSSLSLAAGIVQAYKEQYKYRPDAQDYTQSAIRLDMINDLKMNIDDVANGIKSCMDYDAEIMTKIVTKARKSSIEMYATEYIDLYSFYSALLSQLQRTSPKSSKFLQNINRPFSRPMTPEFQQALNKLSRSITDGMKLISKVVVLSVSGPALANARGISIYYPSNGKIHLSYYKTFFAKESAWMRFLISLRV